MKNLKVILPLAAASVGVTGIAMVPILYKSFEEVNSGGKAVSSNWPKGTTLSSEYPNFGDTFAPLLVDLNKTDNVFWKDRLNSKKSLISEKGEITSPALREINDERVLISSAKKLCLALSKSINGFYYEDELDFMWQICSVEGDVMPSEVKDVFKTRKIKWKVSEVCDFLIKKEETICKSN